MLLAPTKLTVLVPTYRRPHDLERCLAALRRQTEPADEVLVVAHRSDDETLRLLHCLKKSEPHLRWLTVAERGQVAAVNKGLAEVRSGIVAMLDDDAAPHPEWLTRIRRHFQADSTIGGVGGRDYLFRDGELWTGQARAVGKVQWFGRVIGGHHLGFGGPRDVDVLKGANMSFRHEAIKGLRFDTRLRGGGAQVHNDLAFCLEVKGRGWRLVYDPAVSVDHFPALRHDYDHRWTFSAPAVADGSHNETLTLLERLPPLRRIAFMVFAVIVGTRAVPGLLQFVRLALHGDSMARARTVVSLRGRWEGWQTWRRSARPKPPWMGRAPGSEEALHDQACGRVPRG
jgi:GT2 family glycosyltransferase